MKKIKVGSTKIFMLWLVFSFFLFACKRMTDIHSNDFEKQAKFEKFFQNSQTVDIAIKKVIQQLNKTKNENPELFERLIDKVGYPRWDKTYSKKIKQHNARVSNSSNDTIVIIPFTQNTNLVTGYIEALINDTIQLGLQQRSNYKNYDYGRLSPEIKNAEKFAYEFMLLEKRVFSHKRFKVVDSLLFKTAFSNNNTSNKKQFIFVNLNNKNNISGRTTGDTVDDDVNISTNPCVEIWFDPDGDEDPCDCSGNEYFDHYEGDCGGGGTYIGDFGNGFGDYTGGVDPGIGGGSGGDNGGSINDTPSDFLAVDEQENPELATLANNLIRILKPEDTYYFDNTISVSSSLSFNTVSEFKDYLNTTSLNITYDLTTPPTINSVGDSKIENVKVVLITFPIRGGIDIDVKSEKDVTGKWNVINVTSSDFGNTFAWSWEQKEFSQSTSGNEITIIVKGYVKYNVFLEGIGTVYKKSYNFKIVVDKTTGKITSIVKI